MVANEVSMTPLDSMGFQLVSGGYVLRFVANELRLTRAGSSSGLTFATLGEDGLGALANVERREFHSAKGRPTALLAGETAGLAFTLSFDIDARRPGLFHWQFKITPRTASIRPPAGPELALDRGHRVTVFAQQAPMAAGLVYLLEEELLNSTLFYFQDLTALNAFFAASGTRPMEGSFPVPLPQLARVSGIVGYKSGGLGLELPCGGGCFLPQGENTVISDGYLGLTPGRPTDEPSSAYRFLEDSAIIYGRIARPETEPVDWQELARRTLADLPDARNWAEIEGRPFLCAYVNDDRTTAELISQLDVLTSLRDYGARYGRDATVSRLEGRLAGTLTYFYSQEAQAMLNQPLVQRKEVDSWYFYMALVDLSGLARRGDAVARRLLMDSVERAIEVAHRYEYVFPIFFDPTGRRELPPPDPPLHPPREYDVAGAYAYLMLDLYQETRESRYLAEAQAAIAALSAAGYDLAYELHVTALAATACARLFSLTGERGYLEQSYLPLACFIRHCWLWECQYGFAAHYRTFFGLSPMTYAGVITPKEQYEAWRYLVEYLRYARDAAPPAVRTLVAEYCRHTLNTMRYAFAPLMPPECIVERPTVARTVSRTAPELYIPLEDIRDGWRQSGDIAQELYGAGMALTFAAEAYVRLRPGLTVYAEYPLVEWDAKGFMLSGTPDFRVGVALLGDVSAVTGSDGRPLPLTLTRDGSVFRARGGERYQVQ